MIRLPIRRRSGMSFAVLALATMALGAAPSLANQLQVKGGAAMAWHVIISPSCSTRRPRHAFHDALVRPSPSYTMGPSLAESWEESEDGKIYEFKLRAGLKFHNGDPLTTELDVIRASTGTGAPGPRPCATTSSRCPTTAIRLRSCCPKQAIRTGSTPVGLPQTRLSDRRQRDDELPQRGRHSPGNEADGARDVLRRLASAQGARHLSDRGG